MPTSRSMTISNPISAIGFQDLSIALHQPWGAMSRFVPVFGQFDNWPKANGVVLAIGSAHFYPMSVLAPVMRGQRPNLREIGNVLTFEVHITRNINRSELNLSLEYFLFNS